MLVVVAGDAGHAEGAEQLRAVVAELEDHVVAINRDDAGNQ
jgi:hypothetical protein